MNVIIIDQFWRTLKKKGNEGSLSHLKFAILGMFSRKSYFKLTLVRELHMNFTISGIVKRM